MAKPAPTPQRLQRAVRVAAVDLLVRSLDEGDDRLLLDRASMRSRRSPASPPRGDSQLVDGAVAERLGQRVVHASVLVDEREAGQRAVDDGDVEVVAPAGAVDDLHLLRSRECRAK